MNPLELPGPSFLVLYLLLGIGVVVMLWRAQSVAESGPAPRIDLADPYRIAYLRGGVDEVVRVALVTLIDRGLLEDIDNTVMAVPGGPAPRSPLEQAIVQTCERARLVTDIVATPRVVAAAASYEQELMRLALLPDAATRAARRWRLGVAIAVLVGIAAAKIAVALSHGRTNVGGLVVLTGVFVFIAVKATGRFRTGRGNALVADARRLFRRLQDRAGELSPGANSSDLALATAVFGVAVLPTDRFRHVPRLFPRATSSSSSCGSSCGSCGGGGGDGGGCGGCGGGGGGD